MLRCGILWSASAQHPAKDPNNAYRGNSLFGSSLSHDCYGNNMEKFRNFFLKLLMDGNLLVNYEK